MNEGGNYTIRVDAEYSRFIRVKVDGTKVPSNSYVAWSGSTYVKFKESFMRSLNLGQHKIQIEFTDGVAETTIEIVSHNVVQSTVVATSGTVSTGDESNMTLWFVLLLAAFVGAGVVVVKRKKTSKEDHLENEGTADEETEVPVTESEKPAEELSLEELEAKIKELEAQLEEES